MSRLPDLVIVEGPTGVGKGTLIRRLSEAMGGRETMHFARPPQPDNARAIEQWYAEAAAAPLPRILDRWFPSNLAYSRCFGNQQSLTREACERLEVFALTQYNLSVSAVTLVASPRVLLERHERRATKPTSDPFIHNLWGIARAYAQPAFRRIPHTYIKTDALGPNEVFDRARHALEVRQR